MSLSLNYVRPNGPRINCVGSVAISRMLNRRRLYRQTPCIPTGSDWLGRPIELFLALFFIQRFPIHFVILVKHEFCKK